jgi:hypothetical protein
VGNPQSIASIQALEDITASMSPKAAKRKEKKERRKSESGAAEMLPEV